MAVLVRYTPSSLTREKYDAVNEVLMSQGAGEPPEALMSATVILIVTALLPAEEFTVTVAV